jgi:nucleotide-binding universal stress UspA family protein
MFQHILMPTDGTTRSEAAMRFGMRLAKSHGARATALSVVEVGQRSRARAHLDFASDVARANGVACELLTEHGDKPYEHIVAAAQKLGCDHIVMATHAREGVEALVLGSQTQKVLARSKVPVVVCRE